MKDPEGIRTQLSFGENIADISLSHLLELMLMLRSYKEGLVIVGGWVPYFLLKKFQKPEIAFQHAGSIDIDIAIDPKVINETQYARLADLLVARGYTPNSKVEFSYIKKVKTELGEREIIVDFLAPYSGGTGKSHRNQRVQNDFFARKAQGADLALTNRIEFTLEGVLPSGADATATFYIANIVAILAMKGYVLGQRLKEKDAYDIYSLMMYYKSGVESIVEEVRPFVAHELIQKSLQNLKEHFKSKNAVGSVSVAVFFGEEGDQREQRVTQAYLQVQRFLTALSDSPQSPKTSNQITAKSKNKLTDKMRVLIAQALEGIEFLKKKEKLKNLRYSDKVGELEKIIKEFSETGDLNILNQALHIYRSTNIAALEGEGAYETTIWNTELHVKGKATTLENVFNDLVDEFRKIHN